MLPEHHGQGYFVNVRPDLRYHIVTTGHHDDPPIIMLHGFPEFWWSWRYQLRFFGENGYRAIAPDFRGINYSDKPTTGYDPETLACDVIGMMDELGYEQAVIMGNDYGGIVGYVLGLLHPQRIKKLIAINALHPARWPNPRHNRKLGMKIFTTLMKLGKTIGTPALEAANQVAGIGVSLKLLAHNKKAMPYAVRHAHSQAYARYASTALAYVPAFGNWLLDHFPDNLTFKPPILVLWPQKDIIAPQWITRSLAPTIPHAQLVFVPDAGHWVQQEQPDFVNETVLRFLQEGD